MEGDKLGKDTFVLSRNGWPGGGKGESVGMEKGGVGESHCFFSRAFPVFTCNTSYQLKISGNLRRVPEISENNVVKN